MISTASASHRKMLSKKNIKINTLHINLASILESIFGWATTDDCDLSVATLLALLRTFGSLWCNAVLFGNGC
jgi:hypothetical protein